MLVISPEPRHENLSDLQDGKKKNKGNQKKTNKEVAPATEPENRDTGKMDIARVHCMTLYHFDTANAW